MSTTSAANGHGDSSNRSDSGRGGSGKTGPGKTGPGKTGPGKTGPGKTGSGKSGTGKSGTGQAGTPGRAQARTAARAQRALRSERSRRRATLWVTLGTAVIVIIAAVIAWQVIADRGNGATDGSASGSGQIIPATPTGQPTVEQTPKRVTNTTGVPGVLAWDTEGWPGDGQSHPGALDHDHVTGPVTYAVTPPVGGPHNATWMNAGVYTKPIPPERAVHNLEHGAVWITYDPDLPAAEVTQLTAFVTRQSMIGESEQAVGMAGQANRYIDLSPWPTNTLPSAIVLSSWGYQLRVTSPTDPRMQQFVDTFRHSQKYTPEYGSAVDGIPVQIGGRPAQDGGAVANPTSGPTSSAGS